MLDDFLARAVVAGAAVAVASGPMGCFVVWRRMAYFGDTMAHSALLGVGLGLLVQVKPSFGVLVVTPLVAVTLLAARRTRDISNDTLLGILAHGSLALGLLVVGLLPSLRVDLTGYLFGDILAIGAQSVYVTVFASLAVLIILTVIWRRLLALTVSEDIALSELRGARQAEIVYVLLLAVMIAFAMQVVGILLITSLLIIPAAAARRLVAGPEAMALLAALLGCCAVGAGIAASFASDTASGPSIVVAALALFGLSRIRGLRRRSGRDRPISGTSSPDAGR